MSPYEDKKLAEQMDEVERRYHLGEISLAERRKLAHDALEAARERSIERELETEKRLRRRS